MISTKVIDSLQFAGYTEDELARTLQLTYKVIRQQLTQPCSTLSSDAIAELKMEAANLRSKTDKGGLAKGAVIYTRIQLAKDYNISVVLLNQYLYQGKGTSEKLSDQALMDMYFNEPDLTIEDIAKRHSIAPSRIVTQLRDLGLYTEEVPKEEMVRQMLAVGHSPPSVAQKLDIAINTVYSYSSRAQRVKQKRTILTQEQWSALLASFFTGTSITTLANHYDVSRGAIYKRLEGGTYHAADNGSKVYRGK